MNVAYAPQTSAATTDTSAATIAAATRARGRDAVIFMRGSLQVVRHDQPGLGDDRRRADGGRGIDDRVALERREHPVAVQIAVRDRAQRRRRIRIDVELVRIP